jgi:xanthine dehydrogenase accessory factor
MKELAETLAGWRAEGAKIGRAVVIRSFGSSPRLPGAVLLATADGRIAGSVSGGCVEGAAFDEIQHAFATGRSRVVRYGISDEQAWAVGLACGGVIDVLIEPAVAEAVAAAAMASAGTVSSGSRAGGATESADGPRRAAGRGRAVITELPADSPGPETGPHATGEGERPEPPLVVWEDGTLDGTLGDPALDAELARLALESLAGGVCRTTGIAARQIFIEAFTTRPRLVVVGATQVAIPLVALAETMGFETIVVDGRPAFATRGRFPNADRLVVAWPVEAADAIGLGPFDSVAILSHDPKFDEPAIAIALARGCRYVGALGSRKTQAERRERLLAEGTPLRDLDRLRGPIGLDLGGRAPEEIALAVMAEIVAMRHGGTGMALRDKAGERRAGAPSSPGVADPVG